MPEAATASTGDASAGCDGAHRAATPSRTSMTVAASLTTGGALIRPRYRRPLTPPAATVAAPTSTSGPSVSTRLCGSRCPASDRSSSSSATPTGGGAGPRTAPPQPTSGIPTPDGPRDLTDELGMFINGRRSIHQVTTDDLIAEGTRWGIFQRQARATVLSTITEIGDALDDAAGQVRRVTHMRARRRSEVRGEPGAQPSRYIDEGGPDWPGQRAQARSGRPGHSPRVPKPRPCI